MPGFQIYQEQLKKYFADDNMVLPFAAGRKGSRAVIRSGGWTVRTVVYDLLEETVLEIYATHPSNPDRHVRFTQDGRVEELPVIQQLDFSMGVVSPEEEIQQLKEIREYNQQLMLQLSALGLL